MTDQIRRSANSVVANIAEGQGRYSFSDRMRIMYQARGEIMEVRSHLRVAHGLRYLTQEDFEYLDSEYEGLLVGLNKYIKYLAKVR